MSVSAQNIVKMQLIEASDFRMGSDSGQEDEAPAHWVTLQQDYWIGVTEITNAQAASVFNWALAQDYIKENAGNLVYDFNGSVHGLIYLDSQKTSDEGVTERCRLQYLNGRLEVDPGYEYYPLVFITRWGALAFCNFASMIQGLEPAYNFFNWSCDVNVNGYRLPCEAEWEYAAGSGTDHVYYWGDDWADEFGNILGDDDGYSGIAPVAQFKRNGQGLYDMAGNVWELCNDKYAYYNPDPFAEPKYIVPSTDVWVTRGGGWNGSADLARIRNRNIILGSGSVSTGFRIVRSETGY